GPRGEIGQAHHWLRMHDERLTRVAGRSLWRFDLLLNFLDGLFDLFDGSAAAGLADIRDLLLDGCAVQGKIVGEIRHLRRHAPGREAKEREDEHRDDEDRRNAADPPLKEDYRRGEHEGD